MVVIDRTYPMKEGAKAMRYLGRGHTMGKVVMEVGDGSTPLRGAGRLTMS
jgi:hypothetical protein